MQALLEFLQGAQIPTQRRGNICDEPARSITVGAVPLRRGGFGVSRATCAFRGELATRPLALLQGESIAGDAPPDCFTSICLNSSEGVDANDSVPADPVSFWSSSLAFWIWLLSCSDRLRTVSSSATGTPSNRSGVQACTSALNLADAVLRGLNFWTSTTFLPALFS